jgi:hypothetical protein
VCAPPRASGVHARFSDNATVVETTFAPCLANFDELSIRAARGV